MLRDSLKCLNLRHEIPIGLQICIFSKSRDGMLKFENRVQVEIVCKFTDNHHIFEQYVCAFRVW